jgi:hypothetical protein
LHHFVYWYVGVSWEGGQPWVFSWEGLIHPSVFPKTNKGAIAYVASGHRSVQVVEAKDVFPLERSNLPTCMWHFVSVISEPN